MNNNPEDLIDKPFQTYRFERATYWFKLKQKFQWIPFEIFEIMKFDWERFTISPKNESNSDICFNQVIALAHRRRDLKEQAKSCVTEFVGLKAPFTITDVVHKFIQITKWNFKIVCQQDSKRRSDDDLQ